MLDEIRICSACGRQIVVRRRTAKGEIVSEFVNEFGAAFVAERVYHLVRTFLSVNGNGSGAYCCCAAKRPSR
jgi:hypothetical protein